MKSARAAANKASLKDSPMYSLQVKLKSADPEIQKYVRALEGVNQKLQNTIAKLQADNTSKDSRIVALEQHPTKEVKMRLTFGKGKRPKNIEGDAVGKELG
ncbi:MAG: hypothetical protein AABZ15_02825 [Nitrospirota bacterium]